MKVAVIYFSLTGNTQKVADEIMNVLTEKGITFSRIPLKAVKRCFLVNFLKALFRGREEIEEGWDLSGFDFIFLGSPVWAFSPHPSVNTFLEKSTGLEGKKGTVFVTYGGGLGKERTLRMMKEQLIRKGMKEVSSFSISERIIKRDKNLKKKVEFFVDSSPLPHELTKNN